MAERHLVRGILAGVVGGLVASWVMNEFSSTLGQKLSEAVESPAEQQQLKQQSDGEDATMKAADKVVETVTGGRHLSHEQREVGGPIVHYAMGAISGGIYGALAEYTDIAKAGFGTTLRDGSVRLRRPLRRPRRRPRPMAHRVPRQLPREPARRPPGLRRDDGAGAAADAQDSVGR